MLSWSSEETNTPVNLMAVADPAVDPLIPGGVALLRFTDAVLERAPGQIALARGDLDDEVGRAGVVKAAGVIGNFQMMNRVADGMGMPVGQGSRIRHADLIEQLGLGRLDHTNE
jgi:hypothetical protein